MTKVRYYCHVGAESGYGVAANEMAMAMLGAGIDLEISTTGTKLHNRYLPLASLVKAPDDMTAAPDVVIVHTLPLSCAEVLDKARVRELYPDAVCIAYTTWEGVTPISPIVEDALREFDYVWVPSESCKFRVGNVIGAETCKVVPHAYMETSRHCLVGPRVRPKNTDGTEVGYAFYYVGAWNARKNPADVVRAFRRAFAAGDDVGLHMQCANARSTACKLADLETGVHGDHLPPITFSNHWASDDEMVAIRDSFDCFVSASRGEAWNLPAFEAMLHGNHVIAPFGQGSDEFLKRTSADLYNCRMTSFSGDARLEPVPDAPPGHYKARYHGAQGMTVRDDWWDPDVSQLSLCMRRAFIERVTTLRVDYEPAERFGRAAVGRLIRDLLGKARRIRT